MSEKNKRQKYQTASILLKGEAQRDLAVARLMAAPIDPDRPLEVLIREHAKGRSLDANAKMWAMLGEISQQVVWHGSKLTPEEWKDVFTAGLKKQKVVPDIEGTGFVVCGTSTSKMSVKEMAELIELMEMFGATKGVKFRAPDREC